MIYPRISIKGIMAFVVLVGVGLAALAQPNNGWAIVMSSVYVTLLLTSILGLVLRRGPRRAFWFGFAIFGWSFFLLTAWFTHNNSSVGIDLYWTMESLVEISQLALSFKRETFVDLLRGLGSDDNETRARVTLSLMGLSFAWLGSRIARFLSRNEPPTSPSAGETV